MGQPTPFIGRLPLWCVLAAAAAVLPSCATLKAGANAGFSSPGVGYKLVTLGDVYACALRVDGGLACWGSDLNHDATSPPAGRFVHVDAGATCACAVRDNGTLACWGLSQQGACNPPPGNQYTRVSVGKYFSCAVLRDGTAQCWGGAKFFAAAASGTIVDVEATTEHVCFVTSKGDVSCLGRHAPGCFSPPAVKMWHVSMVATHESSMVACGLGHDESIRCWGYGAYEEGKETVDSQGQMRAVTMSGDVQAVGYGLTRERAATIRGIAGSPQHGAAAQGVGMVLVALAHAVRTIWPPYPRWNGWIRKWRLDQPPAGSFVQVAVGFSRACGLRKDGTVTCWGGCGDTGGECQPPPVRFKRIASGMLGSCGITQQDRIACWGVDLAGLMTPP